MCDYALIFRSRVLRACSRLCFLRSEPCTQLWLQFLFRSLCVSLTQTFIVCPCWEDMAVRPAVVFMTFVTLVLSCNVSSPPRLTRRNTTGPSPAIIFHNCSLAGHAMVNCELKGKGDRTTLYDVLFKMTLRILDMGMENTQNYSVICRNLTVHEVRMQLTIKEESPEMFTFQLPEDMIVYYRFLVPGSQVVVQFSKQSPTPQGCAFLDRRSIFADEVHLYAEFMLEHGTRDFWNRVEQLYVDTYGARIVRLQLFFDDKCWIHIKNLGDILREHNVMQELQISQANLSRLDGEPLPMTGLYRLELPWNLISNVDEDWFERMKNLSHLSLAHNRIQIIPYGISSLKRLKFLDLSFNPIAWHESTLFYSLRGLSGLKLSLAGTNMNTLKYLQPILTPVSGTNQSETSLVALDVSLCNISSVEGFGNLFQYQFQFERLNLSSNNITYVPHNFSEHLTKIEILDLSHNNINTTPDLQFGKNTLDLLDLSSNGISSLDRILSKAFLRELNLSGNSINSWEDPNVFLIPERIRVHHVNLSYNSISSFSDEMIESISKLESVDLGGNVINCGKCPVEKLQACLTDTCRHTLILNKGSRANLRCSSPLGFHGYRPEVVEIHLTGEECYVGLESSVLVITSVIMSLASAITGISLLLIYVCYRKRYEISYALHLLMIRRQWKTPKCKTGLKYDAFVCYSKEDHSWVLSDLVPTLESEPNHFKLCLRDRDVALGASIMDTVVELLNDSRNTIIILSYSFINSQWCKWEMEHIRRARNNLILVEMEHLDRQTLPLEIKYLMDTRTYVPWEPESHKDILTRLVAALANSGPQPASKWWVLW